MKNTALTTGAAALILAVGLAGHFASGAIYSSVEARDMISALSSPALYLGSAIAGSASTTLALMLTLLGLVRRADAEFDPQMYRQIYRIAVLATLLLAGAVVMLLLMTMLLLLLSLPLLLMLRARDSTEPELALTLLA